MRASCKSLLTAVRQRNSRSALQQPFGIVAAIRHCNSHSALQQPFGIATVIRHCSSHSAAQQPFGIAITNSHAIHKLAENTSANLFHVGRAPYKN